jgi:hypothetical protein
MNERQLDIFKGKRQRGVSTQKSHTPTEFEIHCVVADLLRRWIEPGWMWFHPPNGGERPAVFIKGRRISIEGGRLKRMGAKPGVSDILLAKAPSAQLHALELKRRGEQPTDEQLAWLQEVEELGGVAGWADSVKGAVEVLKKWGALSTRIKI